MEYWHRPLFTTIPLSLVAEDVYYREQCALAFDAYPYNGASKMTVHEHSFESLHLFDAYSR
jgi:hypothetical protein